MDQVHLPTPTPTANTLLLHGVKRRPRLTVSANAHFTILANNWSPVQPKPGRFVVCVALAGWLDTQGQSASGSTPPSRHSHSQHNLRYPPANPCPECSCCSLILPGLVTYFLGQYATLSVKMLGHRCVQKNATGKCVDDMNAGCPCIPSAPALHDCNHQTGQV